MVITCSDYRLGSFCVIDTSGGLDKNLVAGRLNYRAYLIDMSYPCYLRHPQWSKIGGIRKAVKKRKENYEYFSSM